jgi:DNA mismatch repair protein MutL
MSIQRLPHTSSRTLSSTQVLLDPSSVVKELIDNAVDARATSIAIEISANTLNVIQVRDNGHGIAPEDRGMVGKRFCTSKIRELEDLDQLGQASLGFRGEALSSLVDVAATVEITTRVEGESMAVKMELARDGIGGQ